MQRMLYQHIILLIQTSKNGVCVDVIVSLATIELFERFPHGAGEARADQV